MKKDTSPPNRDAIAACARQLWEEAGSPPGRDEEFWLQAEQQLRAQLTVAVTPPPSTPGVPPITRGPVPPPTPGPSKKRPRR